jgi:hypothetical protein
MEAQPHKIESEKAEKTYNKYRKEYEEKQNQIFFAEHKSDEWFKEKYDPLLSDKLREERRAEAKANADRFLKGIDSGKFDQLNLDYSEFQKTMPKGMQKVKEVDPSEKMQEEDPEGKMLNEDPEVDLDSTVDITGAPLYGFDPNSLTLFIKAIPKFISRWDLTDSLKKISGFMSLSLSEPLKSQDFIRFGWILFDTEENCNKAYELLNTLIIKGYSFNIVKSKSQRKPIKISSKMDNEKIKSDLDLSRQLIEALDSEKKIGESTLFKENESREQTKQLDLQLLYLRKIHSYCFYCAAEYHDERMLAAKCGPIHLRGKKIDKEMDMPDLPDWHKRIYEIIRTRIEESKKKPVSNLEEIEKNIDTYVDTKLKKKCEKLERGGSWPCKYCNKAFKDDHFVIRHIKSKHDDKYSKLKKKTIEPEMYENYCQDKNKITPNIQMQHQGRNYRGYNNYHHKKRPYHGGREGGGDRGNFKYQQKSHQDYKDLDDPKISQVKTFRTVVDYADL